MEGLERTLLSSRVGTDVRGPCLQEGIEVTARGTDTIQAIEAVIGDCLKDLPGTTRDEIHITTGVDPFTPDGQLTIQAFEAIMARARKDLVQKKPLSRLRPGDKLRPIEDGTTTLHDELLRLLKMLKLDPLSTNIKGEYSAEPVLPPSPADPAYAFAFLRYYANKYQGLLPQTLIDLCFGGKDQQEQQDQKERLTSIPKDTLYTTLQQAAANDELVIMAADTNPEHTPPKIIDFRHFKLIGTPFILKKNLVVKLEATMRSPIPLSEILSQGKASQVNSDVRTAKAWKLTIDTSGGLTLTAETWSPNIKSNALTLAKVPEYSVYSITK